MKRFFSTMMLGASFLNANLPVFATEIFAGGADGFGAQINDLGGATINQNTGTQAQLGITGNGNVIKWDHLNVGAGNKLDFNFTQAGQVALNKVNGGVSKFAGTVSTSGENGHLVISNPNGMVFMNGSVINADAGSATFTTHDVNWDGQKNGAITTNANGTNKGISIGGVGNGNNTVPVFRVAKDLNIIAPGIDVSGADLFAGGTVRMVSADGVNFVANKNTTPVVTADSKIAGSDVVYNRVIANNVTSAYSGNSNSISMANTTVKATKSALTPDGCLHLYAKGDITFDNLRFGVLDAKTQGNMAITGTTVANNSVINAGNIDIKSSTIKDSELNATNNINTSTWTYLNNTKVTAGNGIYTAGGEVSNNSQLNAKDINSESTTFRNSILTATNDIISNKWTYLHDSAATAGNNLTINSGAGIYGASTLTAGNDMKLDQVYVQSVVANAGGEITLLGISASDANTNKLFTAKTISTRGGAFGKTIFNATDNIAVVGSGIYNGSFVNAGSNIDISYGANIQNSQITANDNISIDGTTSALYLNNVIAKTINGDINIKNTGNGSGLGIENTQLTAGDDITISNARLANMKTMTANDTISIANSTAIGDLRTEAGKNTDVNGLKSDANVTIIANDTINLKNMDVKGKLLAMNADKVVADSLKANFMVLGGSTKDKGLQVANADNANWHNEWNPSATSVTGTNLEADLDLRLISKDTVVANGLKSGGEVMLKGNDINASNITVTDQKIRTHYPSTNTTLGLNVESYDQWASGWGAPNGGGEGTKLTLNNVNINDKAALVQVTGFENVDASNITTPVFIVESSKNVNVDGLKVDDIHLSNLYATLFGTAGTGYFDTESVNIQGIAAFTQGRDVTLNESFDPNNFDTALDKIYGYKHNLLVLQYLNGDYDKVDSKANNTNLALVNYIGDVKLDGDKIAFEKPPTLPTEPVIPTTPVIPAPQSEGLSGADSTNRGLYGDYEIEKIAEDIDTIFRKQFTPRSFAASDDEIKEMKNAASANTVKDENGTVKLNKEFRAY